MKLFYPLCLAFILLYQFSTAQTLSQGLIAHYCLNGDAQDATGTKHGVLMNGASGTLDRNNNTNGAIRLDGINDFIQLPSDQWITGDFSFSGWINIKSVGSWPHLWGFGNGTNSENVFLGLGQGTDNTPHLSLHDCQSGSGYDRVPASSASPLNTWFHIVVTMVGADVKIYKNNVLWSSGVNTYVPCFGIKDSAFIGKSNFTFNNNALVDAEVDDFRFYNRVLTAAEITELSETESSLSCASTAPNSTRDLEATIKTLNVYPNPNSGRFTIQTPDNMSIKDVEIYDPLGSKISFEHSGSEIDVSKTLAAGIYHIKGHLQDGSLFSARLLIR